MSFLASLQRQHEAFATRYPVGPPKAVGPETVIPDPLAPPPTLRGRIDAAVWLLRTVLRR